MERKQGDLFKAETTWFHVFVSMIENGDVILICFCCQQENDIERNDDLRGA